MLPRTSRSTVVPARTRPLARGADPLSRAALRVLPEDRALALRLLDGLRARREIALSDAAVFVESSGRA